MTDKELINEFLRTKGALQIPTNFGRDAVVTALYKSDAKGNLSTGLKAKGYTQMQRKINALIERETAQFPRRVYKVGEYHA